MAKHRGHNEGSVFKTPSGKWRAQVSLQGRRLSKTCDTAKEAREWIRKTLGQIDKGLTMDGARTTVNEFLDSWLAAKESTIRPRTHHDRKRLANEFVRPYIGDLKLKDVRPGDIQELYRIAEEKTGARMACSVHEVISGVFRYGVKLGLIGMNPDEATVKPKYRRKEMKVLDETQVSRLLASLRGHRREALIYLAVTTGMRRGELAGLRWSRIDWDKRTIRIEEQAQKQHGEDWEYVAPKTHSGRRTVAMGDSVIAKLKEQYSRVADMRAAAGDKWQDNDLVFPNRVGNPLGQIMFHVEFTKILDAAGLPHIRFHDLRHTAASLMLNHGQSPLVVSKILGHSTPSITMNIYGHLMPQVIHEAADMMDELVAPVSIEI